MQVLPPDDQMLNFNLNQSKLCYLVANMQLMQVATDASGAIWWPNFLLMQVAPFGGQIYN